MMNDTKLTDEQAKAQKRKRIMDGVNVWGGFYRSNPHRFCIDFLNIRLKLFQKILVYAMMTSNYFLFCASRGLGKTWLTALFCVIRSILYPGTKICVASSTRSQANEVLSKIVDDFCKNYDWGSANLNREISYKSVGANKAVIEFKNGSWIKVVTASDSGRSSRANIIVVDEYRMVDLKTIETVLRRFLTTPRQPLYLQKPEYRHMEERNKEIYMSSCWLKSHWSYKKVQTYVANMFNESKKYFCCGLPYQIAIYEGLLQREQVEDEMSEADFDQLTFDMEMGCFWFGDSENSFFTFDNISECRKIKATFPSWSSYINKGIKIPDLGINERRILSIDVALMASKKNKKNDASSIMINSALLTSNNTYLANIVFSENHEGLTTDELGLLIMRYYYKYHCTDIALDTNGVGAGVYDFIIKDQIDPETNEIYPALSCCNDSDMAERCKVKNADKVIWSIKATETFNSKMCLALRNGFQQNKINLLISEFEAENYLSKHVQKYNKLSGKEQLEYKIPYVQTTLLERELVSLEHEVKSNTIKIKAKSGMRKDRYSSLGYNYWVMSQIERELRPKQHTKDIFYAFRKPNIYGT